MLSGKYSHQAGVDHPFNVFGNAADPVSIGSDYDSAHVFEVNDSHTFNPTTLLTVSYGVARGTYFYAGAASMYPNVSPVDALGEPQYLGAMAS